MEVSPFALFGCSCSAYLRPGPHKAALRVIQVVESVNLLLFVHHHALPLKSKRAVSLSSFDLSYLIVICSFRFFFVGAMFSSLWVRSDLLKSDWYWFFWKIGKNPFEVGNIKKVFEKFEKVWFRKKRRENKSYQTENRNKDTRLRKKLQKRGAAVRFNGPSDVLLLSKAPSGTRVRRSRNNCRNRRSKIKRHHRLDTGPTLCLPPLRLAMHVLKLGEFWLGVLEVNKGVCIGTFNADALVGS